jgi:UDP-N-acetylmuramyl pentapeptide phosphotransferase/UDP-N-acetylglucosamine-1-phosphate transferase
MAVLRMSPVPIGVVSFAVSAGFVGLLASKRISQGVLDMPNARSLHTRCVPRTGGVGLLAAAAVTWLLFGEDSYLPLLVAAAALAAVSFVDDIRGLPVGLRLAAHAAAALFVVLAHHGTPALLVPLAVLAIVWTTNLFNFMDGADGLAGGMAGLGFAGYAIAAHAAGDNGLAGLAAVLSGAAAGFLLWNFNPASIFLGDAGSIPLGFLAGWLGLAGWQSGSWPLWFPLLVFSPFIVDATVTLLKRLWRGERLPEAHREHYYQRLILAGWTHKRTALAAYALMAIVLVVALATRLAPSSFVAVMLALVAVAFGVGLRTIDRYTACND